MNGRAVMIGRLALIELAPPVLARAMEPFPVSVRARRPPAHTDRIPACEWTDGHAGEF
jgi:hypothetical protein